MPDLSDLDFRPGVQLCAVRCHYLRLTAANTRQGRAERAVHRMARHPVRGRAEAGKVPDGALVGAGASAHWTLIATSWQLRLSTSGARRAAACALPHAPPVTGGPPSLLPSVPAWERPSSRHSSLEPTKITVKSAAACGLRVLRMALRATLDCDLGTAHDRACREDGQEWTRPAAQRRRQRFGKPDD